MARRRHVTPSQLCLGRNFLEALLPQHVLRVEAEIRGSAFPGRAWERVAAIRMTTYSIVVLNDWFASIGAFNLISRRILIQVGKYRSAWRPLRWPGDGIPEVENDSVKRPVAVDLHSDRTLITLQ